MKLIEPYKKKVLLGVVIIYKLFNLISLIQSDISKIKPFDNISNCQANHLWTQKLDEYNSLYL